MNNRIVIQRAIEDHAQVIAGFQVAMAKETEDLTLMPETVLQGVCSVLIDSSKGFYLVGMSGNEVVASLMITPEWSDWRAKTVWWIQSLYVIPAYRRQGIYRMMYEFLQNEVSMNSEVAGIRLYVDKTNVRAQEVYRALGMNGEHYQLFEWMD